MAILNFSNEDTLSGIASISHPLRKCGSYGDAPRRFPFKEGFVTVLPGVWLGDSFYLVAPAGSFSLS